jgi:hypothetical protein
MSASRNPYPLPAASQRGLYIGKSFIAGYGLVLLFAVLVALLILAHGGRVLNIGYPAMSLLLAGSLFRYHRSVYVAFVWWIWLFTPEIRRLVDYQSSYHAISPVMLAPLLVTLIAFEPLVRRPYVLFSRRIFPFTLFGLALVYALVIGGLRNGWVPAAYDFANWAVPLGFALFFLVDIENFSANRAALMSAVMLGLLGTSVYGLYQFYHFPPWDAYWLAQAQFASAGPGVAEQVRLFGPLNSPGPYGFVLMVSLVFAQAVRGPLKIVASMFGYPAFGLSLVRSAWGAWAIALLYLFARSSGRTKINMLVIAAITAVLVFPLVTVGPVASALSARFATFENIQNDGSYKVRQSTIESFYVTALSNPIGGGLGTNGSTAKLGALATGWGGDAGILNIPFEFGWVGGAAVLWALGWIIFRILKLRQDGQDTIATAATGAFFGLLFGCLAALQFSGVDGLALWACGCLAYQNHVAG